MKKNLLLIISIFLLTGCNLKTVSTPLPSINNPNDVIDNNSNDEATCNYKPKLLTMHDTRKIYTYCLNDIELTIDNKNINLKDYIKSNKKSIEKIIDTLEFEKAFDDGGTTIYKNDKIKLIKCNKIDGNKDIYIGKKDMKFKQNFCKEYNYTFIRTYKVNSIEEYKEQQYENGIPVTYGKSIKVELKQFQGEIKSVIINNLWDTNLEINKTYEFEFMLYNNDKQVDDNIESIFKNSTIVEVRETTKEGLEQIQEEIN